MIKENMMKKMGLYLLCLLMAMQLMSCSKNKTDGTTAAGKENAVTQGGSQGSGDINKTPAGAQDFASKAEEQNNDFGFRLWSMIDQKGENTFFSPYSINTALAMVYNGSDANTAKEIARVMAYDFGVDQAHPSLTRMHKRLNAREKTELAEIKVVNGLFAAEKNKDRLIPSYLDLLSKEYLAELYSLDFDRPAQAADFINKWVEKSTHDRIKDMVDEDQIRSSNDGLVLANAIYFKAGWLHQFSRKTTHEDIFFTSSSRRREETTRIDMMEIKADFPYAKLPGYQLLEMPYADPDFSMLFILPDEIEDIAKKLDTKTLEEWQKALGEPEQVQVFIPRFKMEESLDKLVEVFQKMGMKDAFDSDRADFSGIMKYDRSTNLYIQDIAHKAFLQIQEEGTEAAAATTVIMATKTMAPAEGRIPVFRADQPFLCLILHKPDNTILFAGKVVKPEAAEK